MRIIRGRWTPADRAQSIYRELPFDVAPGARAVSVRLRYDRSAAVIDLGAFDPMGFRGWSGSSREAFTITPSWATPGYLPGPLTPGEWLVHMGLYLVPEGGVDWELELDFGTVVQEQLPPPPPRPPRPPRRKLPARGGRHWVAGDLHTHTVHSDGTLTPVEVACLAHARGLDFLAVTDHNTISHHAELPAAAAHANMLLVAGAEITTERGHANVLGGHDWIDFRRTPDEWLADAEAADALLAITHPLAGHMGWRLEMKGRPPLVEVWHSTWDRRDPEPLDWWKTWGKGLPVGGSDFHRFGSDDLPGAPTTWLEVEDDDVLGALRAGRIALSGEPDGPVALRHDGDLVVVDGASTTLIAADGETRRIASDHERLKASPGLYRLVSDDGLTVALTP
jgi:hypothetical protein